LEKVAVVKKFVKALFLPTHFESDLAKKVSVGKKSELVKIMTW